MNRKGVLSAWVKPMELSKIRMLKRHTIENGNSKNEVNAIVHDGNNDCSK